MKIHDGVPNMPARMSRVTSLPCAIARSSSRSSSSQRATIEPSRSTCRFFQLNRRMTPVRSGFAYVDVRRPLAYVPGGMVTGRVGSNAVSLQFAPAASQCRLIAPHSRWSTPSGLSTSPVTLGSVGFGGGVILTGVSKRS